MPTHPLPRDRELEPHVDTNTMLGSVSSCSDTEESNGFFCFSVHHTNIPTSRGEDVCGHIAVGRILDDSMDMETTKSREIFEEGVSPYTSFKS